MTLGIVNQLKKHRDAYAIALLGFLVSLGLFYALQTQEKQFTLHIAQSGVEVINNHLQAELAFNAHLLRHVADQISKPEQQRVKPGPGITDFLSTYTQLKALAEITPDIKIKWLETNSKASPYKVLIENFLQNNAKSFFNKKSPWVSSQLSLPHEKTAFIMILPYLQQGIVTRYFLALIDSRYLIHHQAQISGMAFTVYLNKQPLNPDDVSSNQPWLLETSKILYDALWEIKAQAIPTHFGLIHFINREASLSWITFILGILISLLLAKSTALSDLLKERTVVLGKMNQNLKEEIHKHDQTEASKKNLEKALLQGQKLQAIGTLAGGIAHDFNNILYAIRGYIELAREEIPQDGITYKNLGKVLDATYRGQDLITQILMFSRRHLHHEFSPLSLKTEITAALALLRPTVPQTVDIVFEAFTEGKIRGNKTQIHQIIVNLINNAVDAMDGEGKITITLTNLAGTEVQGLKISQLKLNKYCRIDIKDTGYGMDQSTIDRVFEPFFTTKEVGKGTGLGLSTVHSIVKDHQGEIVVNSQVGKGSTFTLFFPQYENSEKE